MARRVSPWIRYFKRNSSFDILANRQCILDRILDCSRVQCSCQVLNFKAFLAVAGKSQEPKPLRLDPYRPEFPIWTSGSRIIRFSCPRHNKFATRVGPSEIACSRQIAFTRLTSPASCRIIDFSDAAPIPQDKVRAARGAIVIPDLTVSHSSSLYIRFLFAYTEIQ